MLGTDDDDFIDTPDLNGPRSPVSIDGISKADLVFIPLEDGDRAEKLAALKKDIVNVDLNPLSRTAVTSTVTIVDNIVRVMPLLIDAVRRNEDVDRKVLLEKIDSFSNRENLDNAISDILKRFE